MNLVKSEKLEKSMHELPYHYIFLNRKKQGLPFVLLRQK